MTTRVLDEPTLASPAAAPAHELSARQVTLPLGHLLAGRYRIEAAIGVGGMATVYRAMDIALRRPVAVKVFGPAGDDLDLPGIDDAATRIGREIRTHAGLRHPGVIQLLDAQFPGDGAVGPAAGCATDPTPWGYLVLELASGGTVAEALRVPGRPGLQARALAAHVADALAYLHEQGIAHCDIKPANIVLAADGRAKVVDLGIAVGSAAPRSQVPSGWLAGTARYASPEQLRGRALTTATDIYSLGLVLLDVLGAPRPASSSRLPVVDVVPVEVPMSVGPQWFWLLTAMLAGEPSQRPSAVDVVDAVRRMASDAVSGIESAR